MFYYCDEYAAYQNLDNEILDEYGYNWAEREQYEPTDKSDSKKQKLTEDEKARKKEMRLKFQRDFRLLELSEPDWCVYHAKVATRFMCGA